MVIWITAIHSMGFKKDLKDAKHSYNANPSFLR